ncbi:hypothetical protein NSK_005773 [Nannochloropsis salina CCMP1776]|uniref:DNA-(apurinic or apyrimidinic site) lyase n=1 Tax=Nannochloropsis salina CCMP1776 TaxID=1027361 RepID=A0A4D9CXL3_9STRA|nr:hypothetical protein NSK_005773 [Nannochloropsis salina CCMP1776]|eukprot:TFJ82917.1 hypothetical protein NSK_005773 [Nannochloropsis salina CCMP1776]
MAPKRKLASTRLNLEEREYSAKGWMDLDVPPHELRPEFSLTMGQCFNWRRQGLETQAKVAVGEGEEGGREEEGDKKEEGGGCDKVWIGVLDRHVLEIRQTPTTTLVRRVGASVDEGRVEGGREGEVEDKVLMARLQDYFQVNTSLRPLYHCWAEGDVRMKTVAEHLPGVRVLRQDPVECLFSFICSSNNNIPRIALMLDRLRKTYGEPLGKGYHAFPPLSSLASASEEELRGLGLGYRARFIKLTASQLLDLGGREWLMSLREKSREEAQQALCTFPGVGRKVADCVALFSLDQHGAIPVDVHVWRIACRDYSPVLKEHKSLTPAVYEAVGDIFRNKFGSHAGWAHSLLFAAELPDYRARLPLILQNEMLAFKKEEGIEKALKREAQKAKRKEKAERGEEERATVIIEKTTEETITDEILRTEERIVELEEEEGKVLRDVKTKAMSKQGDGGTGCHRVTHRSVIIGAGQLYTAPKAYSLQSSTFHGIHGRYFNNDDEESSGSTVHGASTISALPFPLPSPSSHPADKHTSNSPTAVQAWSSPSRSSTDTSLASPPFVPSPESLPRSKQHRFTTVATAALVTAGLSRTSTKPTGSTSTREDRAFHRQSSRRGRWIPSVVEISNAVAALANRNDRFRRARSQVEGGGEGGREGSGGAERRRDRGLGAPRLARMTTGSVEGEGLGHRGSLRYTDKSREGGNAPMWQIGRKPLHDAWRLTPSELKRFLKQGMHAFSQNKGGRGGEGRGRGGSSEGGRSWWGRLFKTDGGGPSCCTHPDINAIDVSGSTPLMNFAEKGAVLQGSS